MGDKLPDLLVGCPKLVARVGRSCAFLWIPEALTCCVAALRERMPRDAGARPTLRYSGATDVFHSCHLRLPSRSVNAVRLSTYPTTNIHRWN